MVYKYCSSVELVWTLLGFPKNGRGLSLRSYALSGPPLCSFVLRPDIANQDQIYLIVEK